MNGQGNGGIYSKFQERLRKIRLARSKKRNQVNNEEFIQSKVQEIRQSIRKDTTPIYKRKVSIDNKEIIKVDNNDISEVIVNIRATAKDRRYNGSVGITNDKAVASKGKVKLVRRNESIGGKVVSNADVLNLDRDKAINVDRSNNWEVKRNKKVSYNSSFSRNKVRAKAIADFEKQQLLQELGTEIIDKIKESFEDKLDELEVLESELFLLSQKQDSELELKKVKEIRSRINELIIKINEIIDQYNLYNRNYYIDNVIGIDDKLIVDDIINYRSLLDSLDGEKKFVKEYKALEEFKSLYNNLLIVKEDTEKLQRNNEEKINEYDIRDKKYDKVKLELIDVVDIDKKCSIEIERQNKYFDELMDKIDVINREEYVTRHMRGIGELLSQSLRYMGLMVLSPLAGLIPGIAMQTIATRRMIGNVYRNLHMEEIRHVNYEAVNYSYELNNHLNDVEYTENLLEDTIRDIERLKNDFLMFYNSKIPGYEDTLKKIEKIENKLLHNQNKVMIVKNNLKKSKKINEDKLKKVKRLNDQQQ
ncbi:MAG: hypothetical protein IJ509_03195 [Bacilli bacterium]|nr:hypothetical protein [Bacilli bacterium]